MEFINRHNSGKWIPFSFVIFCPESHCRIKGKWKDIEIRTNGKGKNIEVGPREIKGTTDSNEIT